MPLGLIKVIIGCMYASKTSYLQASIEDAQKCGRKTICFTQDERHGRDKLVNHDGKTSGAVYCKDPEEILKVGAYYDIVAIDEGQFYSMDLVRVCQTLALSGVDVLVAGLDQDFQAQPFAVMMALVLEAEEVIKLNARCKCGSPAIRNYRTIKSAERIVQGAEGVYEALCRKCYSEAIIK